MSTGVVRIRHELAEVIRSDPAALRELAGMLPPRWVDSYRSKDSRSTRGGDPLTRLEDLTAAPGVVRFLHLELIPGLREPIKRTVEAAAAVHTPAELPVLGHSSVLYIASPGGRAEVHVDRHHNLFLQLRGVKRFGVGRYPRATDQAAALASEFSSAKRPLPVPTADVEVFELRPGDGLYIPPYTLHWVESDEPTVSAGCAWKTSASEDLELVRAVDARLHRFGVRTAGAAIGRHPRADRLKAAAARRIISSREGPARP